MVGSFLVYKSCGTNNEMLELVSWFWLFVVFLCYGSSDALTV